MESNRIWLVTGISSGLGKAISNEIMSRGDYLIGTFRKEEQVHVFNEEHKGYAESYLLDITDSAAIKKMVSQIEIKHGTLDFLVNNAGIGMAGGVEETSLEEVRKVFEVNFFGTLDLTQQILPIMRKNRGGHIVQISSHAGIKAFAGFGIYNASKFALEGLSEALAQELEPLGIKLTIVEPGPFRTDFAGRSLLLSADQIEDYKNTTTTFRKNLLSVNGKQEGDPQKAASILFDHINQLSTTLRLPLGKIPLKTIQLKIDSLQSDLDENREKAMRAVY